MYALIALALSGLVVGSVAAPRTISQKNKRFSIETLELKVGDTIVFKNDDAVVHNVYSTSAGHSFNLKTQVPGVASPISFSSPGTVQVRCAFHPTMKLSVVVK